MTREEVYKGLEQADAYFRSSFDAMYGTVACEKFRSWVDAIEHALALLKEQEPRVMTLYEVKMLDRDYYYLEAMRSPGKELREIVGTYGLECVTWPSITWARQTMGDSGYGKTWRCWTSRPDQATREATPWSEQDQREYQAAVEMAEYCERYEPTYNAEDGSM